MTLERTHAVIGRGLLAAFCAVVLTFQLMAAALAGSSHVASKFSAGEIALVELCGTVPGSKGETRTHIEGVNTCCVWAKSVALDIAASSAPSAAAIDGDPSGTIDYSSPATTAAPPPRPGRPTATGPPQRG
jgi:hypothetical protein